MKKFVGQILKRFAEWMGLKEKLHANPHGISHFAEGEIWWASIGENIGSEINGKSGKFSRPVLIFKKLSKTTFLAIPTTSQNRIGNWYIPVQYNEYSVCVILSQVRVLDSRRLREPIGRLNTHDLKKVKEGLKQLYLR